MRDYLIAAGFEVRAEVNTCDLVARKPDRLIVVEMKRHLSIDLLAQALERLSYADAVFVAIPKPQPFTLDKAWLARVRVLRQLGLGLMLVDLFNGRYLIEEALAPRIPPPTPDQPASVRKAPKKRQALEKEFANRQLDLNIGGSHKVPLMTAHREIALLAAFLLASYGPQTAAELRARGGPPGSRTSQLLRRNIYGWYIWQEEGRFDVSPAGREALTTYAPLVEAFRAGMSNGVYSRVRPM